VLGSCECGQGSSVSIIRGEMLQYQAMLDTHRCTGVCDGVSLGSGTRRFESTRACIVKGQEAS
jgi:hypothetical protein